MPNSQEDARARRVKSSDENDSRFTAGKCIKLNLWQLNPDNDVRWRPLKTLKHTGTGVGTRYEGVVPIGPKEYPYVNELTAYEPPRRLAWKAISSAGWLIGSEGSYTLKPEGRRTRWTIELTLEPNSAIGTLLLPLAKVMPESVVFGSIPKKLKKALEEQPPRP